MIARVKMAPVERWCDPEDVSEEGRNVVGMDIEILTETMKRSPCGGVAWRISDATHERLHAISGCRCHCPVMFICEHMLEMD